MIELIAIGDEVLYGYTVNSNASFIAQTLLEHGFQVVRHTVVGDDAAHVKKVLTEAFSRGAFVITTGGLGPTCDDWTRKIVADWFDLKLVEPQDLRQKLISFFGPNIPTIEDQVLQPEGAHLFENRVGTASGFAIEQVICLPGVPQEMKAMLVSEVIPYLQKTIPVGPRLMVEPLHFHTLKEQEVDPVLRTIQEHVPGVTTGIYPGYSTLTVHLVCRASSQEEKKLLLAPAKKILLDQFGGFCYSSPSGRLSEAVHIALLKSGIRLACAESCTGGALSAAFVQYPDASHYFQGGIVAYANAVKQELLDVDTTKGTVRCEVTEAMASGVRSRLGADCGIGVSGILGPSGGTDAKPVGTVCASISLGDQPVVSWTMQLKGNRTTILEKAIQAICAQLFQLLSKNQTAYTKSQKE